jgi:hypothetical protein
VRDARQRELEAYQEQDRAEEAQAGRRAFADKLNDMQRKKRRNWYWR